MNIRFAVCGLFLSAGLLSSCTKKNGENQNLDPNNNQTFDIMSTKSGSWWLYNADDGSVFYRYATDKDTSKDAILYKYYYRIDTTSRLREQIPEFFGKNSGKYISLIDLDGKQKNYITYVILKEGAYVGQSWDNTERRKIEGVNVDMLIESEVKSVSDVLVLNGHPYDSVIHVYNNLKAKIVGTPLYTDCGDLDVWFRIGVGILKENGNIDISPAGVSLLSKTYKDYLLEYHVEP
ncbi:MAG: hypothetical protein QM743_07890 [Chitinophagaceae bacterium]